MDARLAERFRQAGTVVQRFLTVDLLHGRRHAAAEVALAGDLESDRAGVSQGLTELREQLPSLPTTVLCQQRRALGNGQCATS